MACKKKQEEKKEKLLYYLIYDLCSVSHTTPEPLRHLPERASEHHYGLQPVERSRSSRPAICCLLPLEPLADITTFGLPESRWFIFFLDVR